MSGDKIVFIELEIVSVIEIVGGFLMQFVKQNGFLVQEPLQLFLLQKFGNR